MHRRLLRRLSSWLMNIRTVGHFVGFWATVCKTVRPMLSDRCPVLSVLSVLSVTLVYCGQTVGRIKMKLGTVVGLGPGHTALDGDPAPPRKGKQQPHFRNLRAQALPASV